MKKPGLCSIASIAAVAAGLIFPCAAPATARVRTARVASPVAGESAPVSRAEAEKWRQDLEFLAQEMPIRHRNLFHTMSRERFGSAVEGLRRRIPTLARHQIIVELARLLALVGDGHTNLAPTRDPKIGFRAYPIALYRFKDGMFVRSARRDLAGLVGARVVRIGTATTEEAWGAVRELISRDNEMGVRFFAPLLLSMPEVLHALGFVADMNAAPFVVENESRPIRIVLAPDGPVEMMPGDTDTSWSPREGWVDARDGAKFPSPFWLEDPRNKFRFEYLPDSRAVYVQFNEVGNKEAETVEAFADRLVAFIEEKPVERLVLDLRLNRGGNGGLNPSVVRGIIRAGKIDRPGKLFVLIGRSTWSAAQMLVNELERFTNAIFIGEPTGGKANHYGDSTRIILPNSGLTARVSTLWWQSDERDLRPWKAPDVAAELAIADYRANRDPVLDAALRYVPRKPLAQFLIEALAFGDPDALRKRYDEWRADPANAYVDAEPVLNVLGYDLLARARLDQAIRVFRFNAVLHPDSANACDSLGEALQAAGDATSAIENYRKALARNPRLPSARDALRKLRARASQKPPRG